MDPRRLLPVLATVATVTVVVTAVTLAWRTWAPATDARPSAVSARSSERAGAPGSPAAVLARWDEQRASAWARGDAARLRRLYAAGSRAGAADVRLLRRYARRGLRVTGLQMQVLDLGVVKQDERRLELLVTDRVVGGVAVARGRSVPLPQDRPSTRRISLVRVEGRWLVDRVRDRGD